MLLPVFNWIAGSATGDCGVSNPGVNPTCELEPLQAIVQRARAGVSQLRVTIDGTDIESSPFAFGVYILLVHPRSVRCGHPGR